MLNVDEILRIPSTQLLMVLRGNKPLLLDKVIYTEHSLAKKLKDSSIYDYTPNWTKSNNSVKKVFQSKKDIEKAEEKKEKLSFDTF